MYCICCRKNNVKPIMRSSTGVEEDVLWLNKREEGMTTKSINSEMIDDGIIHIIDAGYGSKHDGDKFVIAICDECISINLEDATLLYYDNYFSFDVSDEIEKSKQIYRRRKNLDDLI